CGGGERLGVYGGAAGRHRPGPGRGQARGGGERRSDAGAGVVALGARPRRGLGRGGDAVSAPQSEYYDGAGRAARWGRDRSECAARDYGAAGWDLGRARRRYGDAGAGWAGRRGFVGTGELAPKGRTAVRPYGLSP